MCIFFSISRKRQEAVPSLEYQNQKATSQTKVILKVTRASYFLGVPPYFEALWYPHLYFDLKSNI